MPPKKPVLLILVLLWHLAAPAQRPSWRHYTANEGLPGNEVYDLLCDKQGYMWFATEQGICRFNGYEFIRPVDTSAQRGGEAFVPAEDALGRIWFARLDGSVWRIENDTVRAWEHNAVAAPILSKYKPVEALSIAEDGTVWLAVVALGFLTIDRQGLCRVLPEQRQDALFFAEVGGKTIFTQQLLHFNIFPARTMPVKRLQGVEFPDSGCNYDHHDERGIWKLRDGNYLLACKGEYTLIRGEEVLWQADAGIFAETVMETPEGGLLIASHSHPNPGLFHFPTLQDLRDGKGLNLLPGQYVTGIRADREGGWWASTHNAGVFYCNNPKAVVFDELPSTDVVSLSSDSAYRIFAGLGTGDLAVIDRRSGKITLFPRPNTGVKDVQPVYFDRNHERLWFGQNLLYFEDNTWKPSKRTQYPISVLAKRITPGPDENSLWTSSSHGFFRVDTRTGIGEHLGQPNLERTFCVVTGHEGDTWVATLSGLRRWRDGRYELPPWTHEALRHQVRDIAVLPDGGLAFSLPGAGLLIREAGGRFVHLRERDGLNSDFITRLYASAEGELFACSFKGLNRINCLDGRWEIASIDRRKGLPSNHVHDVQAIGGEIWVATDQGLMRVGEWQAPLTMPAPKLERWLVNNQVRDFEPGIRFSHLENNLRIRFYALHYRSGGDIPYRYRLIGADTAYVYTTVREVNYAQLAPGGYTFEVQARNENGEWSEPARWAFSVRPAFWQTRWFLALAVLSLLAGGGLWNYQRLQKARHEALSREKIRELEAAALRAQMNPHFIFNCLGSIQHFIAENDPAAATRYLARFARLVRLALHGSVDGRHSLSDEIAMLENYLELEQLRFRGKFTYEITTSPELGPGDISMPPLLVQPFVENAILHGMKNKAEGGRISIAFFKNGDCLCAEVTDNGPGISATADAEPGRKSVGMMLTERRLEMLAGKAEGQVFRAEAITGPDGSVRGTRVTVRIPLD